MDTDKQRVKNGCTNKLKQSAAEINASLLGYYTEIQEIFKRFEVDEVMPTPEQIKEAFNALHRPAEEEAKPSKKKKATEGNDFYKVFDEFVRDCGRQNDWTHFTYEKFAAVKKKLKDMNFDFVIGNPPYQEGDGGAGASAKPIYQEFVEAAKTISNRYASIIMPARWYTGEKG